MLTFLPFLRAVKASARSLGVCAWFGWGALVSVASAGCTHGGAAHLAPGPATGPLPAPSAVSTPLDALEAGAQGDAPAATPGLAPAELPATGLPALEVSVEVPYLSDARPRSASALQAAADDEELARWNMGGSADPKLPSNSVSYHPGTRVVVDTRQAKLRPGAMRGPAPRGLTLERIQAQARSHGYWPFRLCFENGQREKKSSGGETRVAFSIGTRGHVRAARLLDSELGATSAACMVREVLKLEFTPHPARVLAMVASIKVWPGDAELPSVTGPSSVSQERAEFDPLLMRARVLERKAELSACFSEARRSDPELWGRMALSVILEMDGTVHRVSEVESHFPSPSATRCAQVLISSLQFPSVNGKPFSFVVPLRLSPDLASKTNQPSPVVDPSAADSSEASSDAGAD